jgi:hypothetical protein
MIGPSRSVFNTMRVISGAGHAIDRFASGRRDYAWYFADPPTTVRTI